MAASLEITTTTRLKDWFGGDAFSADWNNWFSSSIKAASKRIEEMMGRYFKAQARTVYADIDKGQAKVFVKGYPITAIASIYSDPSRDFGSGTEVDSSLYTFGNGDEGMISFDYALASGPKALKVTYTGGMGADTAAVATAFPDLVEAAEEQILYLFKNKGSIGFTAVTGGMVSGGGTKVPASFVTWLKKWGDLLPELADAIERYGSMDVERW